jgi:hypothetical protein
MLIRVALVDPCHDPVQPERVEAEAHNSARGLGGVPVASKAGMQHVSHLAAAVFATAPEKHNIADQLACRDELDTQPELLALAGEPGAGPLQREVPGDIGTGHRLEGQVSANLHVGPVGEQRVDVLDGQRAQAQSPRTQRDLGEVNHPSRPLLHPQQRGLGDLAPAVVDRHRVPAAGEFPVLRHGW